jgi:hypothetical protein
MTQKLWLALMFAGALSAAVGAEESTLTDAAHRIAPDDPGWSQLAGELRGQSSVVADFAEKRWFSFKRTPTVLRGEVRISAEHGLSLHYLDPEEQIVIIDGRGSLLRSASGDRALPADPSAGAANFALLHLLRLDLGMLEADFELYGRRTATSWTLALVPRADELRRSLGRVTMEGEGSAVRRIELRRSATQRVEITVMPPRPAAAFTPQDILRFFR